MTITCWKDNSLGITYIGQCYIILSSSCTRIRSHLIFFFLQGHLPQKLMNSKSICPTECHTEFLSSIIIKHFLSTRSCLSTKYWKRWDDINSKFCWDFQEAWGKWFRINSTSPKLRDKCPKQISFLTQGIRDLELKDPFPTQKLSRYLVYLHLYFIQSCQAK